MSDIATITTTLGAITNAIAIAKTIKNVDADLEKAELKLKIAELLESLAKAKISTIDFQDLIQEKDKKIKELEELISFKGKVVRNKNRYLEVDEKGEQKSDPFCSSCYDSEQKIIYLITPQEENENYHQCPRCKTEYGHRKIYFA